MDNNTDHIESQEISGSAKGYLIGLISLIIGGMVIAANISDNQKSKSDAAKALITDHKILLKTEEIRLEILNSNKFGKEYVPFKTRYFSPVAEIKNKPRLEVDSAGIVVTLTGGVGTINFPSAGISVLSDCDVKYAGGALATSTSWPTIVILSQSPTSVSFRVYMESYTTIPVLTTNINAIVLASAPASIPVNLKASGW